MGASSAGGTSRLCHEAPPDARQVLRDDGSERIADERPAAGDDSYKTTPSEYRSV